MSLMRRYTYINVEMCAYALKNGFVTPFQLYIYLRANCSGKVQLTHADRIDIATNLGFKSEKTVRNNLNKLLDKNWIGFNKKAKIYHIRSMSRIVHQEHLNSRTGAEFCIDDIRIFKAFIGGAFIGYLINQQKRKAWLEAQKKGCAIPSSRVFFPVANSALANILGISISSARRIKKLAAKFKFIKIRKNSRSTGLQAVHMIRYADACSDKANCLFIKEGIIYEQLPDLVFAGIRFKKMEKYEHIYKGV